jgi:hypothetical protein
VTNEVHIGQNGTGQLTLGNEGNFLVSIAGGLSFGLSGSTDFPVSASQFTARNQFSGPGTGLTGTGTTFTAGNSLAANYSTSSGIASNVHSGSAPTGTVQTANGSGGTFWATPAAGGVTLTNEFNWQLNGGYIFGGLTNTVTIIGQGEYLQLNSASSHITVRFIRSVGFNGSNVAFSAWVPTTSTATQTVNLAVFKNEAYPTTVLASTNLTFVGSGVATNRVIVSLVWPGVSTNGTAGDTVWYRITGTANQTNWPEALRIW